MWINNDAVTDHRQFSIPYNAGRKQAQLVACAVYYQCMARIVTTTPFVSSDTEGSVPAFVARVRGLHGSEAPISYMALTHYNAVKALQAAWNRAGDVSAAAAMRTLRGLAFASPTGPLTIDAGTQHAAMPVMVARGAKGGLEVVERLGTVAATPGCGV